MSNKIELKQKMLHEHVLRRLSEENFMKKIYQFFSLNIFITFILRESCWSFNNPRMTFFLILLWFKEKVFRFALKTE